MPASLFLWTLQQTQSVPCVISWRFKNCLSRQLSANSHRLLCTLYCECVLLMFAFILVQTRSTAKYCKKNPLWLENYAVKQVHSADNNKEWCTIVHFLSKKTINFAKQQNQWNISHSPATACFLPSELWILSFCDGINDKRKIGKDGHSAPSPFSPEQDQQRGFLRVKSYTKHTLCCFKEI